MMNLTGLPNNPAHVVVMVSIAALVSSWLYWAKLTNTLSVSYTHLITAAQKRGESDLNVSVLNEALGMVGPLAGLPNKAIGPGHDGIVQLRTTAQKAYDDLVPHLHADLNDTQFYSNINLLRNHICLLYTSRCV